MTKLIIFDNLDRKYVVVDPQSFFDHLINFHSINKIGDNSTHEENGRYFTITKELFTKVENFLKSQ